MSSDDGVDVGLLSGVSAVPNAASTGDPAFLRALLDAEVALVQALAQVGLAPAEAVDDVAAAADPARFDVVELARRARASGNPAAPLAADLAGMVPERSAGYVHRGATSQDIMDTAMMLVAVRTLEPVLDVLDRVIAALTVLARTYRDTPMAGRTLTQHAVPTTFGLKAAGWRSLVIDARDRLAQVKRSLPVQLGGAAGTLAAFQAYAAEDAGAQLGGHLVAAYAEATGLATPTLPWHVLRTPIADLGAALAFTGGALGKFAADVLVLSRSEIGEVREGSGGGSSAMPHKSNPVLSTMISAAARQLPALASVLFGSMIAEDERPSGAWHAEWQTLRDALRLMTGAATTGADLAEGLVVHPERMRANLEISHGLIVSERAYIELSSRVGAKAARSLVDEASRRAIAGGVWLDEALGGAVETDPSTYVGLAASLTDAALERQVAR